MPLSDVTRWSVVGTGLVSVVQPLQTQPRARDVGHTLFRFPEIHDQRGFRFPNYKPTGALHWLIQISQPADRC